MSIYRRVSETTQGNNKKELTIKVWNGSENPKNRKKKQKIHWSAVVWRKMTCWFLRGQRSNTTKRQQYSKQPLVTFKICPIMFIRTAHPTLKRHIHTMQVLLSGTTYLQSVPNKVAVERKLKLLCLIWSVSGRVEEKKNITIACCRDNRMIS